MSILRTEISGVMALLGAAVAAKANQLANFPLNFLRTGDYVYSAGSLYNRATDGYWWSATRSSATYASYLYAYTTGISPQYGYYRGLGFALRCVLNYNQLNEWPLQFLRTGHYRRSYGYLVGRITGGVWWSNSASTATDGHYLNSWADRIYTQTDDFRGLGFALCCVGPNYNQLNEWPLQFLRTGYYARALGYLHGRATDGFWWSSTASSTVGGQDLESWTGRVNSQNNYFRGVGFALRGVTHNVRFSAKNAH